MFIPIYALDRSGVKVAYLPVMDMPGVSEDNNVVAWLILGYFCSHPEAMDTAEGIGRWWLRDEGIDADTDVVRGSLAYLVKRRWLTVARGSAGLTMYGLNKNRQYALRQFLQNQPSVH